MDAGAYQVSARYLPGTYLVLTWHSPGTYLALTWYPPGTVLAPSGALRFFSQEPIAEFAQFDYITQILGVTDVPE